MPLYNRKNPRVERYDYTIGGMYFITTCTESRENFFGKIHNKQMILSEIGKICDEELKIMLQKRPDVEMHDYIIMPNHVHLLFSTDKTL
jgi:REP element-mobilizing transposase RayT